MSIIEHVNSKLFCGAGNVGFLSYFYYRWSVTFLYLYHKIQIFNIIYISKMYKVSKSSTILIIDLWYTKHQIVLYNFQINVQKFSNMSFSHLYPFLFSSLYCLFKPTYTLFFFFDHYFNWYFFKTIPLVYSLLGMCICVPSPDDPIK